jgi:SAM-dependent methyltransferase
MLARQLNESLVKLDPPVCPLCHGTAMLRAKSLATAPLRKYWKTLGYVLDAHHPDFPDAFTVLSCVRCGLGTFSPPIIGCPELYEVLGAHSFYYEPARWDHRYAAGFLQKQNLKAFLEFGCGDGQFLDCVGEIVPKVVGVDFNSTACDAARARGHTVFEDWSNEVAVTLFDAIATFQTLEHLPDPNLIVRRLVDQLAPGGFLIVAVPNEDGPLGELSFNPLNAPPHHATLWPSSALRYIADMHRLSLEVYATEPMNKNLYFSLVENSLGHAFKGGGLLARLALKFIRPTIRARAALESIVPQKMPYDGNNHLAIFRKADAAAT